MKLMVVEMQQQLSELEDRERIGGGEGGDPKPPPRGRANPFNSGGEVFFHLAHCVGLLFQPLSPN